MNFNTYSTLVEATNDLHQKGFKSSFKLTEDIKMKCLGSGKLYSTSDMVIEEYHRFEGMTNPADMSIVFVVECTDGTKGTIVSSYGTYADLKLVEFMDKVKIKKRQNVGER